MTWWARYLSIPFAERGRSFTGCDCWGLVRLVYQQERGIDLPAWDAYGAITERPAIRALLSDALDNAFEAVDAPRPWAIPLFRSVSSVFHVGVMVDDCRMLHAEKTGVWVQPWTIYSQQLIGFYMPRVIMGEPCHA